MIMIAEPRVRWRGPLSPLVHLANNWISLLGVVIVTAARVFWLYLLPSTIKAEASSPYIGILTYMGLPDVFFAGLFLIPLGIWLRNRREHRTGIYPASFPPLDFRNRELRRLVSFFILSQIKNETQSPQFAIAEIERWETRRINARAMLPAIAQPDSERNQKQPRKKYVGKPM